jgi:hypothetical protein
VQIHKKRRPLFVRAPQLNHELPPIFQNIAVFDQHHWLYVLHLPHLLELRHHAARLRGVTVAGRLGCE